MRFTRTYFSPRPPPSPRPFSVPPLTFFLLFFKLFMTRHKLTQQQQLRQTQNCQQIQQRKRRERERRIRNPGCSTETIRFVSEVLLDIDQRFSLSLSLHLSLALPCPFTSIHHALLNKVYTDCYLKRITQCNERRLTQMTINVFLEFSPLFDRNILIEFSPRK